MNITNEVKEVELFFFEATYIAETGEFRIFGSISALEHLHDLLEDLIKTKVRGKHYHFDKASGLDGNVKSIVIRKIFQDELPKIPS